MPTQKLDRSILEAAILGFESQKRQIDAQIAELRQMLDRRSQGAAIPETPTRQRKKFSAVARRRMKEAQQRRWARIRGESQPPAPATLEPAKPKRKLSAAGRAAIIAATKKRWAQKRAEAAKAQPAKKTFRRKAAVTKPAVKAPLKKAAKKTAPVKNIAVKKAPAESAA